MDRDKYQRPAKVKNKTPAEIQITAEQILREATDRAEPVHTVPAQKITDAEELHEYRFHKRKTFEDAIRRNKHHIAHWLKYAAWEESQKEFDRARSVFERVLEIDTRNPAIWIRYAEMEMRHKNINLARNLWDRACTQLPRVDQFWYKYAYMEEMLGEIAKARQIFERWMQWRPTEDAWQAYAAFETRYREFDRARAVYRRMVETHPDPANWIAFAKFEESQMAIANARQVYEDAVAYLTDEHVTAALLSSFARFEARHKETARARAVYQYALSVLPKSQTTEIYRQYANFEKQCGDRTTIETVVASKRRWVYEAEIAANPFNYDVWFDLIRIEEDAHETAKAREAYERAVANVPPVDGGKRVWRRYIYLWLQYGVFEETAANDADRARAVYETALQLVPHKQFTFAKLWLAYAKFLIRAPRFDVGAARKALGMALGMCPKPRLFKGYIELELALREFDRVRLLYEKFLETDAANVGAWVKYAELEKMVGDGDRARAILELAVAQPVLDMPEVLWKAYIDYETEEEEWSRARDLYERLLQRTSHVKVWISYAKHEMQCAELESVAARADRARAIFQRANTALKDRRAHDERVILLESWRDFEREFGGRDKADSVQRMFPRVIKKRRRVEEGSDATEEFLEYIWPDDETRQPNLKLLAKAQQWKLKMQLGGAGGGAASAAAAPAAPAPAPALELVASVEDAQESVASDADGVTRSEEPQIGEERE
ncbi:Crooked neck-like protein 1 [Allomyces javanicus]|nr:Crooked neck-like protein 1 [Allomyces javanicus]